MCLWAWYIWTVWASNLVGLAIQAGRLKLNNIIPRGSYRPKENSKKVKCTVDGSITFQKVAGTANLFMKTGWFRAMRQSILDPGEKSMHLSIRMGSLMEPSRNIMLTDS